MSFPPEAVPALASDVRFRVVGGEAVVVKQDRAEVLVLDASGARVLELIDGRRTPAELVAALAAEHEGDPEAVERDVAEFLDELAAAGLVVPAAGEPGPEEAA